MTTTGCSIASPRVLEALAPFGLCIDALRAFGPPDLAAHAAGLERDLAAGAILLTTGPSGSGKSTLLRAVANAASRQSAVIDMARVARPAPRESRAIIDLFRGCSTHEALATLASAGLAEGTLAARTPGQLSDGQRDRLWLALAMHRASILSRRHPSQGVTIIADEFASRLDGITAICLARTLRAWLDRAGADGRAIRIVLATAREDLAGALSPDLVARVHFGGRVNIERPPRLAHSHSHNRALDITIAPGTQADFAALAPLHYRAGPPARPVRILTAHLPGLAEPAGVLTVSMPALNGPWRQLAWPGRYATGDRLADAHKLNDELRTISRVIVDPRCRGIGMARALVRAYLDAPLTPMTEALSAMGRLSPFFEKAGMTPYPVPVSRRDARLNDALAHAGLGTSSRLRPSLAARAIQADPWLAREFRRWAAAARATRKLASAPLEDLCRAAAFSLAARPIAYLHAADTYI